MSALRTVRMPGQVRGLAASGQAGPLFVTSYAGRDLLTTVLTAVSHPGVVEADAHADWRARPMQPWSPRSIQPHHRTPLMVAGDRVAGTFTDDSSGIAVTFFLGATDGRLIAATPPGPIEHKAILGAGEFLISSQGYGAFSTAHYGMDGAVKRRWATHTMPLVDRAGRIRGPEFENRMPSRSQFVACEPDGTVRKGPHLPGYYTSYPVLDGEGTAAFWRAGRLWAVSAEFESRELLASPEDQRNIMSRTLLLGRGQIAFALDEELLLVSGTGLSEMDEGPWPCADGGLHGNPVLEAD